MHLVLMVFIVIFAVFSPRGLADNLLFGQRCVNHFLRGGPLQGLGFPIEHIENQKHGILLTRVPFFDPKRELIYHMGSNGHAQLFADDLIWDSNGNRAEDPKFISNGLSIVLEVGEAYVNQVKNEIIQFQMDSCVNIFSCHHRQLILLRAAGILPNYGPSLFGSTTIANFLALGFKDLQGRVFKHRIYSIGSSPIQEMFSVIVSFEIASLFFQPGQYQEFFSKFRQELNYSVDDLLSDFSAGIGQEMSGGQDTVNYWLAKTDFTKVRDFAARVEWHFHDLIKDTMGLELTEAFFLFATSHLSRENWSELKTLYSLAVQKAAKEFVHSL